MMRASPYSIYRREPFYQRALKFAVSKCGISTATDPQPLLEPSSLTTPFCVSGKHHTTVKGDTCDRIAQAHGVSSAGVFVANRNVFTPVNCTAIFEGVDLCMPLGCNTYVLQDQDSCSQVAYSHGILPVELLRYNSWIAPDCSNLQVVRPILGSVVCLSPPGGKYKPGDATGDGSVPGTGQSPPGTGYSDKVVPPPDGAPIGWRTTLNCGIWHVAQKGDTCEGLQLVNGIPEELLARINPSLGGDCTDSLVDGTAYCVSALKTWDSVVSFPYRNMGCYAQADKEQRVMQDFSTRITNMTVDDCAVECLLWGYPFFGLFNGDACYCDSTLTAGSTRRPPAECNVPFEGNAGETCGGSQESNMMAIWGWPKTVVIAK